MKVVRVLLVDDHRLFREGLANILNSQPDFEVVGEAGDGLAAIVMARKLGPDLILMDVTMPGCDGLEATLCIKNELPDATVVMLTVRDEDEKLFEALRNGAQGYLLKTIRSNEMLEMLRGALRGDAAIPPALGGKMLEEFRRMGRQASGDSEKPIIALTGREREILGLVAAGDTNQEISVKLNISIHTVKTHVRKILAKLQQDRRYEAAAFALREGLISPLKDED